MAHPNLKPLRSAGIGRAVGWSGVPSSITASVRTTTPGLDKVGRYKRPCSLAPSGVDGCSFHRPQKIAYSTYALPSRSWGISPPPRYAPKKIQPTSHRQLLHPGPIHLTAIKHHVARADGRHLT